MKFEESEKANEKLKIEKKERREKMIKKLKKAFTIVELVIVIAVIAILAAVLIPTFSTLIDRANRSSDESAVYNMNLILSSDEAMNGKPENVSQAMDILSEAGMDAREYRALAKNHAFFYNLEENRVMYIDTTTYEISYPEEYAGTNYADLVGWYNLEGRMAGDGSWMTEGAAGVVFKSLSSYGGSSQEEQLKAAVNSLTGQSAESEKDVTVTDDNGEIVVAKISTAEKLISVVDYIEADENNGEGFTVILGDDIDLKNSEWKPIDEFAGSFYGNGKVIDNLQMTDITADSISISAATTNSNYTFYGFISIFSGEYFGDVIFSNVVIDQPGSGYISDKGMNTNNHTAAVAIGAVYAEGDNKIETTISNVIVGGKKNDDGNIVSDEVSKIVGYNRTAGVIGYVGGRALTDTDTANKYSSVWPAGSSVTIKDCINYATVESAAASNTSYATAGGILSITNQRGEDTTITISNCQNYGNIRGQWVGGIMADSWASNISNAASDNWNMQNLTNVANSKSSTNFKYDNAGKIVIDTCSNYGNLVGFLRVADTNNDNKPDNMGQSILVGGIFGQYNGTSSVKVNEVSRTILANYRVIINNCENHGSISYECEYYGSSYESDYLKSGGSIILGQIVPLKNGADTNSLSESTTYLFDANNFTNIVSKNLAEIAAEYFGENGEGGIFLTGTNVAAGTINEQNTGLESNSNRFIVYEGTQIEYAGN